MRTRSGRRRWPRIAGAAGALAITFAIALLAADRQSAGTLDEAGVPPAAGDAEPALEVDLVVDRPRAGREPKGIAWVLCCGAWRPPESYGIDLRDRDDREGLGTLGWARRGYVGAAFAAGGGPRSVDEAVAAYDRLRAEHPGLEICAIGVSAGGHMALMVAARRPELRCVVAHSAPTALASLPDEPVRGVIAEPPIRLATSAFGQRRLRALSPLTHARKIRAAVRLVACSDDRIVPPAQSRRMARALRAGNAAEVELDVIRGRTVPRGKRPPSGWGPIVHECWAPAAAIRRDRRAGTRFVERALAGRR